MQQTPVIAAFGDLALIGRGAFAHVYRGYDEAFNRDVAIKVIDSASLGDDGIRRFERECRAIGAVSAHPKIVTVYSSGTLPAGEPYIVMDLMNGTLTDVLHREGSLPWADAVAIGCDIASAVQAAHDEGILHRDIKPDNILISRYGHAQLADFGISSIFGTALGAREAVTASVAHAAPEVLDGRRATFASDVYALASTVVTMILGRAPFTQPEDERVLTVIARIKHEAPPRLAEFGVPRGLQTVLDKAMAKSPADRYFSAVDFAEALGEFRPRIADTRSLLTSRRMPEPPLTKSSPAPAPERALATDSLIAPGSLIPGGRPSRGNGGLIPSGPPEHQGEPGVPAQADPVGGSNRLPVNSALAGLLPPVVEPPVHPDEPVVEVLHAGDLPADVHPIELEPVALLASGDEEHDADPGAGEPLGPEPAGPIPVRVLHPPAQPVLDPGDPLLSADDDRPVAAEPKRRRGLWFLGGVVALGAAGGGWLALGGHHDTHAATAGVLQPPIAEPLPSPSFSTTCDGLTCTFTASVAAVPADATLQWTFPGGSTAEGATVHHTFASAGDHRVSLVVSDHGRTGAPSAATVTLSSWAPHLSISTSGRRTGPIINLEASTSQKACLAGSAQLQRRSGGDWQEVRAVSFNGSSSLQTDAPASGTYRWLIPASTLPNGECQQATSGSDHVTVAAPHSTATNTSATTTGTTTTTTTTTTTVTSPPPTAGGNTKPSPDPRNNPPVPPGG